MSTQALGLAGEAYAARWLEQLGWTLLERRFRNGHRDLDLVARRGSEFGDPVEAVDWRKRRELIRSAHVWVDRFGNPTDSYRFDVIGVLIDGARVRIRHVQNAFSVA